MLRRFKRAYKIACEENPKFETFTFDGNEFVKNYAKYLVEYLESKLGK